MKDKWRGRRVVLTLEEVPSYYLSREIFAIDPKGDRPKP
jgi:hypothetical protein